MTAVTDMIATVQQRAAANVDLKLRIAANIKAARNHRRLKQSALAHAMRKHVPGWTQGTVSLVERGLRDLRAAELVALGAVLRVDICKLTKAPLVPGGEPA